jgi:hypothetical protein
MPSFLVTRYLILNEFYKNEKKIVVSINTFVGL